MTKVKCVGDEAEGEFSLESFLMWLMGGSPALTGSPTFSSGSRKVTAWGMGWYSENDQIMKINQNRSVTWTDGVGNRATFMEISGSTTTAPVYSAPAGLYVSLTAVSHANGVPTAISERDKDGTNRLFDVVDSTSILRFIRLTDRNGNTVTYTRDPQGRLTRATDIHGRYFELAYSTSGYVTTLTDSGGRSITYAYDGLGRRIKEVSPQGQTAYEYDPQNRMTRITYPNGSVKNYAYDSQNRLLTEDDGNGQNRLTYAYFTSSRTVTDTLGRATVHEYVVLQGVNKVSRIIDPAGGVTSFTYDSNLNLLTQTDPLGRVTRYTYDSQGNVTETQDAAGGRTLASYEPTYNQVASLADPLTRTTLMTYDAKGNLTRIEDPQSNATNKSYDTFGHVSQSRDPLGLSTEFSYEPTNGALASVTDPLSRTTAMETDSLSRVVRNTDPSGKVTQYTYDPAGNLAVVTDAAGNVTEYAYGTGRNAMVLTSVKDALHHTTSFGYDDQGRLTSVTNALGQTKTSEYDAKGNLIRTVNARGQEITYAYDSRDRLTTKTLPEGTISYSYDATGNLTRASHNNGSIVEMVYDSLNRLIQSKQTLPGGFQATIRYAFDANGNRTQMTTPWGNFGYEYDTLNRLTKMTNPQGKEFAFTYDAAGRRTSLTYPNGIEATYTYDDAGQVLSVNHHRISDQAVMAYSSYTYDNAGNRTSMADVSGTHTFAYDDLHRLTSASHPATSYVPTKNETFSYDAVGNRLTDANMTGYVYDAANRLLENSSFTYAYDADGNRKSKTEKAINQTTSYVYDSENQLKEIGLPDGTLFAVKYDDQGRRIEKSTGTTDDRTWRYVYDNEDILAILDGNNDLSAVLTHGPDIDESLMLRKADGSEYFMHAVGLGSIVAHTDGQANLVERIDYQSYGRAAFIDVRGPPAVEGSSIVGSPYAFTGREIDNETGLYNFRARHLDSRAGGFLEEDPLLQYPAWIDAVAMLPSALGTYSYARGNPVRWNDPTGLFGYFETPWDIANIIYDLIWGSEEDLAYDLAALATPLPAGVTKLRHLKGAKTGLKSCKQWHHVWPKYLRGDPKGKVVQLAREYHQKITNEFRKRFPYGSKRRPSPQEVQDAMEDIYKKYPLPE